MSDENFSGIRGIFQRGKSFVTGSRETESLQRENDKVDWFSNLSHQTFCQNLDKLYIFASI